MTSTAAEAHADLIRRFYDALGRRDAPAMARCYAPDATFSDPAFPRLDAAAAAAMWRMLCARGKDLSVVVSGVEADDESGRAHWRATYSFGSARRPVVNEIDATFVFAEGRIFRHVDRYDLRRWAAQALGPLGRVLGGTPLLAPLVRRQAATALAAWRAKERPVRG
ncbi:MAG: nuclear transport factor 2 family protein [Burkholderiales bacterium]